MHFLYICGVVLLLHVSFRIVFFCLVSTGYLVILTWMLYNDWCNVRCLYLSIFHSDLLFFFFPLSLLKGSVCVWAVTFWRKPVVTDLLAQIWKCLHDIGKHVQKIYHSALAVLLRFLFVTFCLGTEVHVEHVLLKGDRTHTPCLSKAIRNNTVNGLAHA